MLRLHADCPMTVGREEEEEEGAAAATEFQPRTVAASHETKSTTDEALKVRIVQVRFSLKKMSKPAGAPRMKTILPNIEIEKKPSLFNPLFN